MRLIGRVGEAVTSQPKTFPKTQSFAVQLIVRHWIALRGCISFPAILQTLTVRMMLRAIVRANNHKKIGNGLDERSHRG
jgi:hypothetical protein